MKLKSISDFPLFLAVLLFSFLMKDPLGNYFYLLLGLIFLIFFVRASMRWLKRSESFKKGDEAEQLIIDILNEWSNQYDLVALAYQLPLYNYHQHIDVLYDNSIFKNLGIEVKYRTIDRIEYFTFNNISRFDRNGFRQSTRQLFSFISKTDRLGLYAFVFLKNGTADVYFLPHYILQKMIDDNKHYITIKKIQQHPHSYWWDKKNTDFHLYVKYEFEQQKAFLDSVVNPLEESGY